MYMIYVYVRYMYALISQYMIGPAMGLFMLRFCLFQVLLARDPSISTRAQYQRSESIHDAPGILEYRAPNDPDMRYKQNNQLFSKYRQFTFHPSHFSAERPKMCL